MSERRPPIFSQVDHRLSQNPYHDVMPQLTYAGTTANLLVQPNTQQSELFCDANSTVGNFLDDILHGLANIGYQNPQVAARIATMSQLNTHLRGRPVYKQPQTPPDPQEHFPRRIGQIVLPSRNVSRHVITPESQLDIHKKRLKLFRGELADLLLHNLVLASMLKDKQAQALPRRSPERPVLRNTAQQMSGLHHELVSPYAGTEHAYKSPLAALRLHHSQ